MSGELRCGASSFRSAGCAVGRGEDVGLSAARYVVAKMLSLSDSWGRSTDDFQSVSPWALGVVLERPVCARVFGVTASCCLGEGLEAPWSLAEPGTGGVFDLTDAGGEVYPWASDCCDMGSTLVRPSRGRPLEGVSERVVAARMGYVWRGGKAQRRANRGGVACADQVALAEGQGGGLDAVLCWELWVASENCCRPTFRCCVERTIKGAQIPLAK